MNRLLVPALFLLGCVPSMSSAVEIKNIRPCYAPFGATRTEAKCLPGDVLFMTYEIEGLMLDKGGKANYVTILELLDSDDKTIFKKETPNEGVVPALGGARMPGDLHVIMGPKQKAGNYSVKLTVHDKNAMGAGGKAFRYSFVVLPEQFGFVGISAPAVGFPGQHYVTGFALVNMKLDGKGDPSAEVSIRILDEKGGAVAPPVKMDFPRDIPQGTDLKATNFLPLTYPLYLNRAGRFTVEITATDRSAKKDAKISYPLHVLDVSTFTK